MLRNRFELGSTLHIYKNEKIQLRTVASTEASYPDSAVYLDRSVLLEAIRSRDAWVFSVPHLELKISIEIESSLQEPKGSLDKILKEIKSTLIKSQLWHDLQVSMVSSDDEIITTQEGIYSLNFVFEFQQSSMLCLRSKPRVPYAAEAGLSAFDLPPSVLRISLHDISLIFNFSSTSSNNSPDGMCSIPKYESFEDLSSTLLQQCGHLTGIMGLAPASDDTYCSSIGGSQTTGRNDDDWMSLDYDSPFSSPQDASDYHPSVLCPPKTKFEHFPKTTYQPFITLLDSGFRTLFCQITPRSTSNVTIITEKPGPSLPEFAPSVFTPGHVNNVVQRSRFIPMISKGIAAMLDNVPRPKAGTLLKWAAVSSIGSEQNSHPDGATNNFVDTANTKSVLKTFLWKSMQHRLCAPEVARQLPSLTTLLKPKNSRSTTSTKSLPETSTFATNLNNHQSFHAARTSDTEWCFTEDSDDHDSLLTDEFNADHEHDPLDTIPNAQCKPSPPRTTAILDDDLSMLDESEQEDNFMTDSPFILRLQSPPPGQSSPSHTTTTTAAAATLIPTPASPPSSEVEILDPSSPIAISEDLKLSPALNSFDAMITNQSNPNLFDNKRTIFPYSNGNSGDGGIGDVEMLLL
ncbi:hypothetical protein ACJ72_02478 [Emergomyces africanus]|uniref:Uncharacterized protein n=1 Tax=Emergomyces africanus TaxID=1955775 RepID=A0A1B7P2C9_9EURO|nr:hypothetical protein ACJ72_02478 [Emergomyces africanus]